MDHCCALDSKFLTSIYLILLSLCHYTLLYGDFVVLAVSAPAIANTSRDQETLLYFKSQLSDPLRALSSWSSESPDLCKWRGITCGRRHPFRVTALDLDSLSLSGPLSSCIANLTFLERIHLPNNRLHGNIPRDIGRLFRLQYLNLSMNSLGGEIPETLSFCSRLRVIILGDNGLNGKIPYNLSKCLKLQTLRLNNNMLEGEIPPGFGSHPNLQTLVLTSNNLAGNIPLLLGSSSSLSLVRLENNKLGGKIPPFLGNSSSLSVLLLSNNSLTGQIPQTLLNSSTLAKIDLSHNGLTGPIPPLSKISSSHLSYLDLMTNSLSGGIPPSLGNLSSLIFLYLAGNKLEGSIPESLGRNIPLLQQLDLSENNLAGSIPSSIYNISSLTDLCLGGNNLPGTIPLDIGHTLPNLESFNMYQNQLKGQIPYSLSTISSLQYVDLSVNSLDGVVPPNLGSLQNLFYLDLRWNLLRAGDWSFLSSLTNCSLLEMLGLQENELEGTLPNSIGNLSPQLKMLLIGGNRLNGSIPDEIGNLVNLTVLYLDNNQFTGIIPTTLGNLQNLVFLQLSCNDLSGPIPSIGNLTQLNHLYMQDNELNGSIPISLGSCRNLLNLNLSYNRLDGIIPKELVSISSLSIALDLSHNHLYGPIPLEVGSLINLGRLDMSENRLSGQIPSALGGCQLLEYLHVEGNFLQGNIPQSFQNLKGIKELDLSRNNLSGPIPEFLESFGSLCYLNLSFNDLEGEVPKGGIFSNLSEVSVLGNSKLCGGDSKLRLPPCSARSTNSRLLSSRMLKVVILVASVTAISLLCLFIFLRRSGKAGKANQSVHYLEDKYKKVTYTDIFRATDRFSPANMVGSGSFGSVYKGKLDAGQYNIAVKVFNLHQHGALKSFTDECEALRNIRHRNLINAITSCSTMDPLGNEFKALIFEYMPNGNLETWLHPTVCRENQTSKLNLIQRLNIAVDVASALSYLHHHCASPIVHCDLKPSNVLLDNEMIARVTDFGLARFLPAAESTTSRNSTSLIGLKGSIGYIAPEYGMGAKISKEGDVYSYGVLLLEMLTGKRPTNEMFKDGLSLHKFVSMTFPEKVEDILDHELFKDEREHGLNSGMENHANTFVFERCIIPLVEIGLSCSVESPKDRPTMEDVASEILAIKEAFSAVQV